MKKDILDLRFIIGMFFTIIGLLLFISSLTMNTTFGKSESTNFWSGATYIAFGILMIFLWNFGHPEKGEENKETKS